VRRPGRAEMDKLTSIKAFTRVVQHGSFAAAARELRLSRSAVSKYVIDLEQALGVQLLVRTTRSASPTDADRTDYRRRCALGPSGYGARPFDPAGAGYSGPDAKRPHYQQQ